MVEIHKKISISLLTIFTFSNFPGFLDAAMPIATEDREAVSSDLDGIPELFGDGPSEGGEAETESDSDSKQQRTPSRKARLFSRGKSPKVTSAVDEGTTSSGGEVSAEGGGAAELVAGLPPARRISERSAGSRGSVLSHISTITTGSTSSIKAGKAILGNSFKQMQKIKFIIPEFLGDDLEDFVYTGDNLQEILATVEDRFAEILRGFHEGNIEQSRELWDGLLTIPFFQDIMPELRDSYRKFKDFDTSMVESFGLSQMITSGDAEIFNINFEAVIGKIRALSLNGIIKILEETKRARGVFEIGLNHFVKEVLSSLSHSQILINKYFRIITSLMVYIDLDAIKEIHKNDRIRDFLQKIGLEGNKVMLLDILQANPIEVMMMTLLGLSKQCKDKNLIKFKSELKGEISFDRRLFLEAGKAKGSFIRKIPMHFGVGLGLDQARDLIQDFVTGSFKQTGEATKETLKRLGDFLKKLEGFASDASDSLGNFRECFKGDKSESTTVGHLFRGKSLAAFNGGLSKITSVLKGFDVSKLSGMKIGEFIPMIMEYLTQTASILEYFEQSFAILMEPVNKSTVGRKDSRLAAALPMFKGDNICLWELLRLNPPVMVELALSTVADSNLKQKRKDLGKRVKITVKSRFQRLGKVVSKGLRRGKRSAAEDEVGVDVAVPGAEITLGESANVPYSSLGKGVTISTDGPADGEAGPDSGSDDDGGAGPDPDATIASPGDGEAGPDSGSDDGEASLDATAAAPADLFVEDSGD